MKLRNALFVAAVLLNLSILTSCSTTDPEPEIPLADQIEGEYIGDSFTSGNKLIQLPSTNSDGVVATVRVIINKLSDSEVDFVIVFKQSKSGVDNTSRSQSDTIQLSKNASGDIIGIESNGYSLKYKNNTVVLDIPNADPAKVLSITASR